MKHPQALVWSNEEIMPGTHLLWLKSPQVSSLAEPGQYVMINCGEGKELPLRRPLSIHRIKNDYCAFLFKKTGKGTAWLSERKPGNNVDLIGPLGNGFSVHPDSRNLLLVAGGIGIAPLRFLVDTALGQGKKITLLVGARSAAQLPPIETPPGRNPHSGIDIQESTEDGSAGYRGMVTELIGTCKSDRIDQVFACGPPAMYRQMSSSRNELGLERKPTQVSLEMRMGCGMGFCYACSINTSGGLKQVCRDGPVFELADIVWDDLISK